jgi:hypothetical protein
MKENLRLYSSIMRFVGQTGVRLPDIRLMATYGWLVVGIILSETIHLSQWLLYRPRTREAASRQRQISRWLHNERIEVGRVYGKLITAALVEWRQERVELALDSSSLWGRYVIVRLALIYRGRAIPLTWKVLERKSTSVALGDYADLLWHAARLLPQPCRVLLLADRGFVDVELMKLATLLGWDFVIRAKTSLLVYRAFQAESKLGRLTPPKGEVHLIEVAQVTKQRFGPLSLALAHMRTPRGYQVWLLLSSQPPSLKTFDDYALRFDIEENFLDDKSAGFQLEASEIRHTDALSRLCLLLATATLYLVATGTAIYAMNLRCLVDTHHHRGLSYLQIGWRWVRWALAHNRPLLTFLWLEAGPDPEPVFASRRQAAKPTLAFSAIFLLDKL